MDFWKQAAADITDTSSILDTNEILDTSAVLDTSDVLGVEDDGEENIDDTNIILRVFCTDPNHKNSEIKENTIVYISSEPKMPNIDIEIEISKYFDAVKYGEKLKATLEIKYSVDQGKGNQRKFRNDVQRYPINEDYVFNVREQSIFEKNGKYDKFDKRIFKTTILPTYSKIFRGGGATLKIYNAQNILLKSFAFQIRGRNPTKEEVKTYLEEKGYSQKYWFLYRILVHESGSSSADYIRVQQFNDSEVNSKIKLGTDYLRYIEGTPQWGYPDGWGMAQIDHGGVANPANYLNANYLWNWKLNIDQALLSLTGPGGYIETANGHIQNAISAFKAKNKDKTITAPSSTQGAITYVHAPSTIPGITVNNYFQTTAELAINEKSIIDAEIIKKYNSYTRDFLSKIIIENTGNGIWEIDDYVVSRDNKIYYVKEISDITE